MENSKTISVSFKGKTAELQKLPNGKWVCTNLGEFTKLGSSITWLDDVRIPTTENISVHDAPTGTFAGGKQDRGSILNYRENAKGRFPANLLVEEEVLGDYSRFFSLDEWAKTLPFLAVPKASKSEKNAGLSGFAEKQMLTGHAKGSYSNALFCTECGKRTDANCGCGAPFEKREQPGAKLNDKNHHPTVKPLKLMSYLITLGSRPGDVVLDPFLGSGTTALAAKNLGREYIGIEREEEYVKIAEARIAAIKPTLL